MDRDRKDDRPDDRHDARDRETTGTPHAAGGPGDGMRTGGSAGTASGSDPMPDEVRDLADRAQEPPRARTKGDGAGTA